MDQYMDYGLFRRTYIHQKKYTFGINGIIFSHKSIFFVIKVSIFVYYTHSQNVMFYYSLSPRTNKIDILIVIFLLLDIFHNKVPHNTGIALPQKDNFFPCINESIDLMHEQSNFVIETLDKLGLFARQSTVCRHL
jgi:hypothetical protein